MWWRKISYAIYKIGAKSVIGLDYGDIGLKRKKWKDK